MKNCSCISQELSYKEYSQFYIRCFFFLNKKVWIIFLFLHENICIGDLLEETWQGASNEHPQHMFLWII